MSQGQMQRHLAQYRQLLLHREQQALQSLERAYQNSLKGIQPRLDRLYDQMVNALGDGEKLPANWLYEAGRLEAIKKFLKGEINHFGVLAQLTTGQLQRFGVQLGERAALDLLKATLPTGVKWSFGVPSPAAIANLVGATQAGSPLADLFSGFGAEAAENVSKALITGLTAGDNPRKVATDVQQALGTSRNRALTISRNEMLRCYKSAALESYRANDDIMSQWRWQADKSGRTCAVCLAMDGSLHDLDEDFESHVQCRCAPVPVTKSWEDILSGTGIDTSIPETSASADDYQSGSDWFAQQSEAVQRQVLGNAKYKAYQNGDLELSDLVGVSHDEKWGASRYEKSLKDALK